MVLVSDCPNISDVYANLSRTDMSASGQLSLIHNISCYLRMFDIDVNNTVNSLTIEGMIKPMEGGVHTGNNGNRLLNYLCSYSFLQVMISLLTIFVIVVVTSALLLILWKIRLSMFLITYLLICFCHVLIREA